MQLRKDNHYVPKLYLKQWAIDGQIATYRLLVPSENVPLWKPQSLKGIAFHQHLYTYLAGQEETDEFERWLDREFENPAEEVIGRVIREERLSPSDWRKLVRFAVAQDVRTPARLKDFIRRQNETLGSLMEDTLHRSIQEMEDAIKRGEPLRHATEGNGAIDLFNISIESLPDGGGHLKAETIVGRRLWIWQMRHLLTNTLGRLPAHRWTILHAPPGISWPTSDNPVIRLNFRAPNDYNFGGGWSVKNGDILLPLSPKHLLYTCIGNRRSQRGTQPDIETARFIQKIIVEHADRYIFAREPSDVELIRQRRVCPATYKDEASAWRNWHRDQCQAELELQRKPTSHSLSG